jgi:hypothetical protein
MIDNKVWSCKSSYLGAGSRELGVRSGVDNFPGRLAEVCIRFEVRRDTFCRSMSR